MDIPEDARERAIAYWVDATHTAKPGGIISTIDLISRAIVDERERATAAERERCAAIADFGVKWAPEPVNQKLIDESCSRIAAAIRNPT